MNDLNPNDEMKLKSFPLDPLRKLIQREDGIPAREFFALSSEVTTSKQLKLAISGKTNIAEYMYEFHLMLCLPFIFGEPPHPGPHTMLK